MPAVRERQAVPRLVPAPDELFEAGGAFGRHHEGDGRGVGAGEGERGHVRLRRVGEDRARASLQIRQPGMSLSAGAGRKSSISSKAAITAKPMIMNASIKASTYACSCT